MTKVHMSNGASNKWIGNEYSELLVEQIAVMVSKEKTCTDYLSGLPMMNTDYLIDEVWRQKAAEWMFKVIDFYDLDRNIVSIGMKYLDQIFTTSTLHHRWDKQQCNLVTMTALKIAIKLFEPRTMNMEDMLKLGKKMGGSFSHSDIVEMEQEMLWKLEWGVYPPTTFAFAHHMICLFPQCVPKSPTRYIIQELCKYMSELAVCVYSFITFRASLKSFACILVALDSLEDDCAISADAMATFLERVSSTFGLHHNDREIVTLKVELKELLSHNTNLAEFVQLIRKSNQSGQESPKTTATSIKSMF